MKFRKDFVTNSSSSSYICDICGNECSGWDINPYDYEMCECENGHILCQEHLINATREELIQKIIDIEEIDNYCNLSYSREELDCMDDFELFDVLIEITHGEIPESMCPLCRFDEYSSNDMARYLLTIYKVPKEEVFEMIKKNNKRRKKLYDFEYIAYVANKLNLDIGEIQSSWKKKYDSYKSFNNSMEVF